MRLSTKKQRDEVRQASIDFHVKDHSGKVQNVYDLTILTYERDIRGISTPCLKLWRGSSAHTIVNCYYGTEERMQVVIDAYIDSAEKRLAAKIERQRNKKNFKPTLKVGDILYTSWGYDQTNVEYYQVTKAKGCFVTVHEIWQKRVPGTDGHMCCDVMPIKDKFYKLASQPIAQWMLKIPLPGIEPGTKD